MKELINKYIGGIQRSQLHIETLTPIAIRNGEVLSPLTDYHIEGNKIYILDTEKLMHDIAQNNWLDDFEQKVLEYSGNHSEGTETNAKKKNRFIADFLKEKGVSIKDYLKEENARISHVKSDQEWVQLHTTIKTNNQAYIPGSSIKGAIRTAVMYHWLTETEKGKELVNQFLESNKIAINNCVRNIDSKKLSRAKVKSNAEKKKKATEDLRLIEHKAKNDLSELLENMEDSVIETIFGKSEGQFNISTFFKISDSQKIKNSDVIISSLHKKYREDDQVKKKRTKEFTTSFQEFLDKGINAFFEITISNLNLDRNEARQRTYFKELIKDNISLGEVFKAINKLSHDFLEFEIGRLHAFKNGDKSNKFYNEEKLESLHHILEDLYKQLINSKNNSALMCIGFGKSVFTNTVLLAIKKQSNEIFTNIVKILHTNHPKAKYFPISYYTTTIDYKDYPLGWIKITDINVDAYKIDYDLPNYESAKLQRDDVIQGVLLERSSPAKVQVSIDGETQIFNANGLSKFEKLNNTTIHIGTMQSLQIVVVKDNIIKDLKFI